jgi:hypothetical protein
MQCWWVRRGCKLHIDCRHLSVPVAVVVGRPTSAPVSAPSRADNHSLHDDHVSHGLRRRRDVVAAAAVVKPASIQSIILTYSFFAVSSSTSSFSLCLRPTYAAVNAAAAGSLRAPYLLLLCVTTSTRTISDTVTYWPLVLRQAIAANLQSLFAPPTNPSRRHPLNSYTSRSAHLSLDDTPLIDLLQHTV